MDTEKALEAILDLERSRRQEQDLRIESEMLLKGLRSLTRAHSKEEVFQALINSLRLIMEFEDAFILQNSNQGVLTVTISSNAIYYKTSWRAGTTFSKAFAGKPVAVFDVTQVEEWKDQDPEIRSCVGSALHIGLTNAIMIVTHSQSRFFSPKHIKKAARISPFLSQTLLTLELRDAIVQRDRFFDLSMDLMAIIDHRGNFKQYNDIWMLILGHPAREIHDSNIYAYIHDNDKESFRATLQHIQRSGVKLFVECRIRNKNGDFLWFSCSLAAYSDENIYYIIARDVTDRVLYEERLAHEARHDSLTGIYNRRGFMDLAQDAFAHSVRYPTYQFAICYLDLNDFKTINDTYGHDHGDKVLQCFANCLVGSIRETDKAARLGGDEFALLIDNISSKNEVIQVVERIQSQLTKKLVIDDRSTKISTSIGISLSSSKYSNMANMLREADRAMYQAKSNKSIAFKLL